MKRDNFDIDTDKISTSHQKKPNDAVGSKKYFFYMLGIMSIFVAIRSYTIDGPKTTALVWYFFPDLEFTEGMTQFTYIGIMAGLGSFFSIFVQKLADKYGRKPILIFTCVVLTIMPLIQIFTESIEIYTITAFFLMLVANVHVWMIYIGEESPQGKNAVWTTFIMIIGLVGSILFYIIRAIFITNDKEYTVLHWKGILYFSVIGGVIITLLITFTLKESSAFEEKRTNALNKSEKNQLDLSFSRSIRIIFGKGRKKAYITLLVISVLFSIAVSSGNLLEPYMMVYSKVSSEEFSLISMIGLFGLAFFFVFTGKIADKFGRKILLVIYGFLYPISVILQYTWGAHIEAEVLRITVMVILKIFGMSTRAGLWTLLAIISIEIIPTEVRGFGNGLQILSMNITGLLSGLIIAPFFSVLGIQTIALIATCFMFAIIPLVIFNIPESFGLDLKKIK